MQTPFPSAPDRAHRWEAGEDSVATNTVSRKPSLGGGGPSFAPRWLVGPPSSLDHPGKVQGPPGNCQGP